MFFSKSLRSFIILKNSPKFSNNVIYLNRNLSIFSRNESKTNSDSLPISDNKLEDFFLPEPPTSLDAFPALESTLTYNHLGEATFQSLGLINNWPTGWILSGFEYLHVNLDMPWWSVIIASSVIIRAFMFPISMEIRRINTKSKTVSPLISKLQKKIELAKLSNDMVSVSKALRELQTLVTKSGYRPYKSALFPLLQFPPFLAMMMSIRKMTVLPVASLQTGGLLWFQDLTIHDPYYLLPITTMLLTLLQMEIGADYSNVQRSETVKWTMRAVPLVGTCILMHFPTALLLYWWSSSVLAIVQLGITKIPFVSRFFNMDKIEIYEDFRTPTKTDSFIRNLRKNMAEKKTLENFKRIASVDNEKWLKAGSGVTPKTFSYDPTKITPKSSPKP